MSFIQQVLDKNSRADRAIFIAWDGQGSINEYQNIPKVVFNPAMLDSAGTFEGAAANKYIDMLVAINSDFFMMNPRSTYSWGVFVVRAALQLESIPTFSNKDVFFTPGVTPPAQRWVGWDSVLRAREVMAI
jgi:hypothetical protein